MSDVQRFWADALHTAEPWGTNIYVKSPVVFASDYDALAARLAEAERDAARYRWLRGSPLNRGRCFSFDGYSLKCGTDLDEAIDAAMKTTEVRDE